MRTKPPALSSVIRALRRGIRPPRSSEVLTWARSHVSASVLARLGRDYLRPSDAVVIERLLRAGRHKKAAQHFCDRFSGRLFPLEYVRTGARQSQLLLEVTSGIQHERYGENWEEQGDFWSLKPVFQLSWTLMEDPYGPLRDEFMQEEHEAAGHSDTYGLCDEARDAIVSSRRSRSTICLVRFRSTASVPITCGRGSPAPSGNRCCGPRPGCGDSAETPSSTKPTTSLAKPSHGCWKRS